MSDEEPPTEIPEAPGRLDIESAPAISLAGACWSVTAFAFLAAGVILLIEGYLGYAIVTLVIGVAAAINLL